MLEIKSLSFAVRVYPQSGSDAQKNPRSANVRQRKWRRPNAMLVFDTETRIDASQRLTFGSYRFVIEGEYLEEGLFSPKDLPEKDREILSQYASSHSADARDGKLQLLTLEEFLSKFYKAVYKGRCLLVGFNLPFDLSRLARDFAKARGRFAGGFSLELWSYIDPEGVEQEDRHRPRIAIKHLDGKRALKGFTARRGCDQDDLIPEGSEDGQPEKGYKFRGHFLDLRTLAFVLTDRGFSLDSACDAFEVEHGKQHVTRHGEITEEYIDYSRRDTLATSELAIKLLQEYDKHPIDLQPTKAYSPASMGKAYLQAMGISPILERQPDFPKKYLGYAQSAFFGGRTSAHIRKYPVPVVYTDFLSMYPTVNNRMGLWRFVIAAEIKVIEHCQNDIVDFLSTISLADLFVPEIWGRLTAFVQLIPDGDILPSRSKYSDESNDWQVGINHVYSDPEQKIALWFSLPDVVASVILTGRIPKIIDAFRLESMGALPGLKSVRLRGNIKIEPRQSDFFKVVIEERKKVATRSDLSKSEKGRLDKALKVIANSTSYGIYAEMIRQESDKEVPVTCYGIAPEPFACRVTHPEDPGRYCFPPLASLITGAARLMLAMLEHCVSELGGTYAMEDTDSMAIVATRQGGIIPCPGGTLRSRDGLAAIKALSWDQVQEIVDRFALLNPYDRRAIPGSILKIEDDNFDPKTGKQRQLCCLAISAKRYALFLKNRDGDPAVIREGINNKSNRWSEHGLGHLLNPTDPESPDRHWIALAWLNMIRKSLELRPHKLEFEERPAVGRITVSSPAVMRPLASLNDGKPYYEQIKPFNFLLTVHTKAFGHPIGADPNHFHLIAPYNSNSTQWLRMDWIDQYTGQNYRVSTTSQSGTRKTARVKTYGDVLREYEFHPESKCADAEGTACTKQTIGLLQRRHVRIDLIRFIGKESNSLEEVDAGLVHTETSVYTEYPDSARSEWQVKTLPRLRKLPLAYLVARSGMSRRALLDIRAGRSMPHPKNLAILSLLVKDRFN